MKSCSSFGFGWAIAGERVGAGDMACFGILSTHGRTPSDTSIRNVGSQNKVLDQIWLVFDLDIDRVTQYCFE